jgi:hypothetical protein
MARLTTVFSVPFPPSHANSLDLLVLIMQLTSLTCLSVRLFVCLLRYYYTSTVSSFGSKFGIVLVGGDTMAVPAESSSPQQRCCR